MICGFTHGGGSHGMLRGRTDCRKLIFMAGEKVKSHH